MKSILKVGILGSIIFLISCGGGNDGAVSPLEYSLYPPGYFSGNFGQIRKFSRVTSEGDTEVNYKIIEISSGADTTFNSQPAKTLVYKYTYDTVIPINPTTFHVYWSTNVDNPKLLGTYDPDSGTRNITPDNYNLPTSATINEKGTYSTEIDASGYQYITNWEIVGVGTDDKKALYRVSIEKRNESGDLINSIVYENTVFPDGTIDSIKETFTIDIPSYSYWSIDTLTGISSP